MPLFELDRLPDGDRRKNFRDILLWLPLNLLQVFSFLLVCCVLIPAALVVRAWTGSPRAPLWMAHKWWGPIVVGGGLASLRVSGLESMEPGRAYLVVANHQSYFDIPVLYSALPSPIHFLGAESLRALPGVGHFGRAVGTIYLPKNSRSLAGRAAVELANYLREGRTTVIFPEGTRSWDGTMGPFFPALLTAAISAGVEILPLAIVNSREVMPRGGGFLFRPAKVEVRIGKPIPTQGLDSKNRDGLARVTWETVNRLRTCNPPETIPCA
jgi:1-acyl-sn-glycerol-3-phosphate acyltransferase